MYSKCWKAYQIFTLFENFEPNQRTCQICLCSDPSQSSSDSQAYSFNMSNLVVLLKRQAEKNVAASYFNVDILKYQVGSQS